jgi:hypothetical protein
MRSFPLLASSRGASFSSGGRPSPGETKRFSLQVRKLEVILYPLQHKLREHPDDHCNEIKAQGIFWTCSPVLSLAVALTRVENFS